MKVLRVRPKHYPEVIDIDCSLESLQKEVEGPIQAIYPWDDEVALICNEEGKLHDDCMEKLNRTLDGPYGIPIDIIVGTLLRKKSSGRCSESTGKSSLLIPSEGRAKMRKRRRSRFWPMRITARKVTFM